MYTIMDFVLGILCVLMIAYSILFIIAVAKLKNLNITVTHKTETETYTPVISDEDKKFLEEQQNVMDIAQQLQNLFVEDTDE